MQESDRPRHIRDIAHLYLSSVKSRSRLARVTVFVSGETKTCFSSIHAANIAVGLSLRKIAVRVYEISGLLPNACFYFAQSPRQYLSATQKLPDRLFPGLKGIQLCMDPDPWPNNTNDTDHRSLDVIHLPPFSELDRLQEVVARVKNRWAGDRVLLVLKSADSSHRVQSESIVERLYPLRLFEVLLERRDGTEHLSTATSENLGGISGWKRALTDRVPVMIRDPQSDLSRAYLSICESLLCRLNSGRRESGGVYSGNLTPTAQPK